MKHPNEAERRIKGWGKDRTGDIEEDWDTPIKQRGESRDEGKREAET